MTEQGAGSTDQWTPEFMNRLNEIYQSLGGATKAADLSDLSVSQLYRWRDGTSRMPLAAAAKLCALSGKSLDWLCGIRSSDTTNWNRVRIESAINESARLILEATPYLDAEDPQAKANAVTRRAMTLLDDRSENEDVPTHRVSSFEGG